MGIFGKPKTSCVGIDLGTASIKLVELANEKGQARLVTYGIAESSGDIVRSNSPEAVSRVIKLLKELKNKSRVTTNQAITALPPFSVFSSILSLPPMPKSDLAQAVKWEAKKFVPMPLEEMILDWKLLKDLPDLDEANKNQPISKIDVNLTIDDSGNEDKGNNIGKPENKNTQGNEPGEKKKDINRNIKFGKSKKNNRVLITAAPKNLVSRYIDIFKQVGFKLVSLETESFALARSLLFGTKLPVLIIDMGSLTTAISIVEDGVPILNRSLDVGGATLTQSITNSLNINKSRAEQFKRDIGVIQSNASSGIPKVIEQTLNPILNEVKYSLSLYQSQTARGVEKVILIGGSAFLPSLPEYLSSILNLNVYVGDPWFRVSYPTELKIVLDEIGSRLAVAVGLAMRDINK